MLSIEKSCCPADDAGSLLRGGEFTEKYPVISVLLVYLQVDYSTMKMFKPEKTDVRRSFQCGLWVRYRMSPHQMQLHFKLHRLQVSTLSSCIVTSVAAADITKLVASDLSGDCIPIIRHPYKTALQTFKGPGLLGTVPC